MAIKPKILIFIGGTEILSLKRMVLHQDIDSHHFLELICRMDALEDTTQEIATNSRNYLGEKISVNIESQDGLENYGTLFFNGIVTKINSSVASSRSGEDLIKITAKSTSVLADDGPHFHSYIESTLLDIVDTNFQDYDTSKLEIVNNPSFTDPIHYSVQNGDSAYQFASRLASQYGEWFYFNGQALVFGKDTSAQDVTLKYGVDLKEYALELNPVPKQFKYYSNDYLTEENHEKSTAEIGGFPSGYNEFTASKSEEIYHKETAVFVNTFNDTNHKNRFDKLAELHKNAADINEVIIKGKSDNPGIVLGGVISIDGTTTAQGSFRITKITHTTNHEGNYENIFEGVTADIDVSPVANFETFPHSNTQIGKVYDNVDPDGMSRVMVQFPWQLTANTTTPWLRVLTQHSGANQGMHFIPEVGDEVIVGFEGGNAERPFVMGSFYTGNNKPDDWQTDANNIKAIRTRSGHTIELNDTEGEEKINIYDNEGSIITFDTQAKSLTINATETIDIAAKNINITAEENITIGAQGDIEIAADGDVAALAQGDVNIQSTGDTGVKSSGAVAIEATTDATLQGMSAIVEGKTSAEVNGVQTKVTGSAMTEVSGGIVKIN